MKTITLLFFASALLAVGCRNSSSGSEGDGSEAVVSSAPMQLNGKSWILNSGFIVDLNPDSASKRIDWMAAEASQLTVKSAAPTPASGTVGCVMEFMYQGQLQRTLIDEGLAMPHPSGRVMFCDRNRLYYAPTDTATPQLLQELGLTASEMSGIQFYRVPTQTLNAWATVVDGKGVVAVYDGLAAGVRARGGDDKSVVAFTLGHEVGHIVDMKKAGFTNLNASRERIAAACDNRLKGLDPGSITRMVRRESCSRDFASNSRGYEYSADNFAVSILARKKYSSSINPYAFADFAKQLGEGKYDAFGSHPNGAERALQLERSLERVGILRKPK